MVVTTAMSSQAHGEMPASVTSRQQCHALLTSALRRKLVAAMGIQTNAVPSANPSLLTMEAPRQTASLEDLGKLARSKESGMLAESKNTRMVVLSK